MIPVYRNATIVIDGVRLPLDANSDLTQVVADIVRVLASRV